MKARKFPKVLWVAVIFGVIVLASLANPPTPLMGYGRAVTDESVRYVLHSGASPLRGGKSYPDAYMRHYSATVQGVTMQALAEDLQNRYRKSAGWSWEVTDSKCTAHGPGGSLWLVPEGKGSRVGEIMKMSWLQVQWVRLRHWGSNPFEYEFLS